MTVENVRYARSRKERVRTRDEYGCYVGTSPDPDVWQEVDCRCRDDGPWTVYGPEGAYYRCAKCGHVLDRRAL